MIAHPYRVAIARILSDLIKSDKIIEKSEITLFNTLQEQFGITQQDRIEAQSITITHAMNCVRDLDDDKKQILQQALLKTAKADNQCVAKEALILLALKYILADTDGKYEVLSCDTRGSYIEDKFIMYIESDEYEDINDDILCDLEGICDKLSLWNFDFVYIPNITAHLKEMDSSYIKDIIRYMKPMFNDDIVDILYDKLTHISTESFTTELLGAQMNMPQLRECEPSLLINFGTSMVPYCGIKSQGSIYTDFLRIRIDTTAIREVNRFVTDYGQFITHREFVRPQLVEDQFKYFGFYKLLFDFLAVADGEILVDYKLVIDLLRKSLWICGREVKLSPTELATYILILQQSIRGYGLRHFKSSQIADNKKLCDDLTTHFQTIYSSIEEPNKSWLFADNIRNIAAYIARIKQKLREQVLLSPDVYIPHQRTTEDGLEYYCTNVNTDNVYVRESNKKECLLKDYRPWR